MRWPDQWLPWVFLFGFKVVGNMVVTGVFKPLEARDSTPPSALQSQTSCVKAVSVTLREVWLSPSLPKVTWTNASGPTGGAAIHVSPSFKHLERSDLLMMGDGAVRPMLLAWVRSLCCARPCSRAFAHDFWLKKPTRQAATSLRMFCSRVGRTSQMLTGLCPRDPVTISTTLSRSERLSGDDSRSCEGSCLATQAQS